MNAFCRDLAQAHQLRVALLAGVLAVPEKLAIELCAITYRGGGSNVIADTLKAIFQVASPGWWQKRYEAFIAGWGLVEVEFEIENVPFAFVLLVADWLPEAVALLDGGTTLRSDCTAIVHRAIQG